MQKLNNLIYHLALRARGYNNCCTPAITGEENFLKLLGKLEPKLCIDVGANVGNYSKSLLKHTKAMVIAFEPLPTVYEELKKIQAEFPTRFRTENLGVGNRTETLPINYGKNTALASFSEKVTSIDYVGKENVTKLNVSVITLDQYYDSNLRGNFEELDLLKVDTEGFEYEVICGAKRLILEMRPKFIQVEFNLHQLFCSHSMISIANEIPDYALYQLLPYGYGMIKRDPLSPEANIYHYSNFVFVRADVERNLVAVR